MAEIKEQNGLMTPPGGAILGGETDPKEDVVRDQMSATDRLTFFNEKSKEGGDGIFNLSRGMKTVIKELAKYGVTLLGNDGEQIGSMLAYDAQKARDTEEAEARLKRRVKSETEIRREIRDKYANIKKTRENDIKAGYNILSDPELSKSLAQYNIGKNDAVARYLGKIYREKRSLNRTHEEILRGFGQAVFQAQQAGEVPFVEEAEALPTVTLDVDAQMRKLEAQRKVDQGESSFIDRLAKNLDPTLEGEQKEAQLEATRPDTPTDPVIKDRPVDFATPTAVEMKRLIDGSNDILAAQMGSRIIRSIDGVSVAGTGKKSTELLMGVTVLIADAGYGADDKERLASDVNKIAALAESRMSKSGNKQNEFKRQLDLIVRDLSTKSSFEKAKIIQDLEGSKLGTGRTGGGTGGAIGGRNITTNPTEDFEKLIGSTIREAQETPNKSFLVEDKLSFKGAEKGELASRVVMLDEKNEKAYEVLIAMRTGANEEVIDYKPFPYEEALKMKKNKGKRNQQSVTSIYTEAKKPKVVKKTTGFSGGQMNRNRLTEFKDDFVNQ